MIHAGDKAGKNEMPRVVMYVSGFCPYCTMAEKLLRARGVEKIEKIRVDQQPAQRAEMLQRTGRRTVPQIYIGQVHVGGYDDLVLLDRKGGVISLLTG